MNKIWYSWEDMRRNVNDICRDITLSKYDFDVILGISRGGLVPGVMISHYFKKPFKPLIASLRDFPFWEDYYPSAEEKTILIVDDICDSGETFLLIKKHFESKKFNINFKFASLWWNNECEFEPHYYANEVEKNSKNIWIQFPWDYHWKNVC